MKELLTCLTIAIVLCQSRAALAQSGAPWLSRTVAATCERLSREHESTLRAAAPARARRNGIHPAAVAVCKDAGDGAWLETARSVVVTDTGLTDLIAGNRVLTFILPDGTQLEARSEALGPYARVVSGQQREVGDLDGDGRAEFLLYTDDHSAPLVVLTARNGAITRAALPANLEPSSPDDVDSDGRMDLLSAARYALTDDCPPPPALDLSEPALQWVALNEGSRLVTDSDEARAFVRAQCPERPTVLLPSAAPSSWSATTHLPLILRRLACARAWGASMSEIEALLPQRWPAPLRCHPRASLVSFAASVRLPFALRPLAITATTASANSNVAPDNITLDLHQPVLSSLSLSGLPIATQQYCRGRSAAVRSYIRSLQRDGGDWWRGPESWLLEAGACHRADAIDAWVDRLELATRTDGEYQGRILVGRSRIEFVGPRGVIAAPWTTAALGPPSQHRWRISGVFDFDHDGQSEAIVTNTDPSNYVRVHILSAKHGAIERYRPSLVAHAASSVADVDDDGQWDLVLDRDRIYESMRAPVPPLWRRIVHRTFVAHGRRDGTFSLDDTLARQWIAAQCPRAPATLLTFETTRNGVEINLEPSAHAVTCARVFNVGAEQLVQRLWIEGRRLDETDRDVLEQLMYAATWRPATRLP